MESQLNINSSNRQFKRIIKPKVPEDYSPHEPIRKANSKKNHSKKKINKKPQNSNNNFHCDKCGVKNFVKGNSSYKKCRHFYDADFKKTLKLCNACGLKLKRKSTKTVVKEYKVDQVESNKQEYLDKGKEFGQYISSLVNDEAAKAFFCPKFRSKPCACLQTFMQSNLNDVLEIKKRAGLLLRYHKKAKELIEASSPDINVKRSKEFDQFVLTNRDYLKSQLRLCEPAVQKARFTMECSSRKHYSN